MNKTEEILPVLPRNKKEEHTNDQSKNERTSLQILQTLKRSENKR